jgi:hypothetical protein
MVSHWPDRERSRDRLPQLGNFGTGQRGLDLCSVVATSDEEVDPEAVFSRILSYYEKHPASPFYNNGPKAQWQSQIRDRRSFV